jgi:acyl-CoA thioester hydrolase
VAFVQPITPRYYEVDQQGVVFNMWYLGWFDEAMTAFLDDIGMGWQVMMREGIDVQLVHTEVDWRAAVRFGDELDLVVTPGAIGTTSFSLDFAVTKDGAPAVTASTVYVVIASDGSGKRPVPDGLRAALSGASSLA